MELESKNYVSDKQKLDFINFYKRARLVLEGWQVEPDFCEENGKIIVAIVRLAQIEKGLFATVSVTRGGGYQVYATYGKRRVCVKNQKTSVPNWLGDDPVEAVLLIENALNTRYKNRFKNIRRRRAAEEERQRRLFERLNPGAYITPEDVRIFLKTEVSV